MRRWLLVPAAVALLATGCARTPSDVVAKVHDDELTRTELEELVEVLLPSREEGDAASAREVIQFWVRLEAVQALQRSDGIEPSEEDLDLATAQLSDPNTLPGFTELDDDLRDRLVGWQATLNELSGQPADYTQRALDAADPWVKPRYGQFRVDQGVLPLALPTGQPSP